MSIQSPSKLIVAAKDGTVVRTVDLSGRRTLTIGRSPDCDLTMDIESISRRHATMICLYNTWVLVDADSKSKFKVENKKVDYATLSDDRPIQIGGAFFWLQNAPMAPVRPTSDSPEPTRKILNPITSNITAATLTIMDLETRPIHTCSLDGEITSIGTSPEADYSLDIEGWSPIQLALIQTQAGAELLDVSQEQRLRFRGNLRRRWSSYEPTLFRCGDYLLQWCTENSSSPTAST